MQDDATTNPPATGPEAIRYALQNIDMDQVERQAREELRSGKRTKRSGAVALLHIARGMERSNTTPADYMIDSVPVIPTRFRPFAAQGNTLIPGDANILYKDLFDVRDAHNEERKVFGDNHAGQSRLDLYDAVRSVYGYGDPVKAKTKAKEVKGFLSKLVGTNSKYCYDSDTEILTREHGWVGFPDLTEDTEVATIHPSTKAFEWQKPYQYTHARYVGDMVRIKVGCSIDQLVTPRHRVWMRARQTGSENWGFVQAAGVPLSKNRHWYQIAACDWAGHTVIPGEFSAAGADAFASWLGWWIAEGDIHTCGTIITITQTATNPDYCAELSELFTLLGSSGLKVSVKCYDTERGKVYHYSILSCRSLVEWVKSNCGHLSQDRFLSPLVRNWERGHLALLLTSYLRGDGNTDDEFITTSHRLLDDLMEVGVKIGICIRETCTTIPKSEDQRPQYRGSVVGKWTTGTESISKSSEVGFVAYDGYVHCCAVKNGLLVVRRNGKAVVSGNSFFQRKLISKTQDNVGRSTIIVDPELTIDQIGLPREMAFTMFAPYIQRRLKHTGMKDADALKAVRDRTEPALKALENEIAERPVLYARPPAWHMHSVLGGKVKLVDGEAIATNPWVANGMGADYDGDSCISMTYVVLPSLICTQNNRSTDDLLRKALTKLRDYHIPVDMHKQLHIPALSSNDELFLTDLADFPHGEFSNTVAGKNGVINFYHALPGTKVLSFDPLTNAPTWKEVSFWSEHPGRKVEIVNMELGRQLYTDNDPRAVYGISRYASTLIPDRFTPTNALKKEVFVPVAARCDMCTSNKDGLTYISLGDESQMLSLDFDFGCLLGSLCGDGWWDKVSACKSSKKLGIRRIYLADSEGYTAKFVEMCLKAYTQVPIAVLVQVQKKEFDPTRYGDTVKYMYSSAGDTDPIAKFTCKLTSWLGGEGDDDTAGSANKHLPPFFLQAPREFREGLLCGLIDTDGSCSVSNAKDKPQLMLSFTSTSLRLCREVKLLAGSLGIRASVSFGKVTSGGNQAWQVVLSSVDGKKTNVLARLKNERKRKVFLETKVSESSEYKKEDKVVYPDYIRDLLGGMCCSYKHPKTQEEEEARIVANSTRYDSNGGSISRTIVRRTLVWIKEETARQNAVIKKAIAYLESDVLEFTKESSTLLRDAIGYIYPCNHDKYKEGASVKRRLCRPLREGVLSLRSRKSLLEWYEGKTAYDPVTNNPDVDTWVEHFVENESISWLKVTSVDKTGKMETGYDLTVPGYETFLSSDGVVLSNTVNVHVPASDAAVKETYEKFMPSTTPFSNREEDKLVPLPKQEQILGLYMAASSPSSQSFTYDTEAQAIDAIRRGQIPLSADVQIRGGIKSASALENAQVIPTESGPVRDPKTGKWLPTVRGAAEQVTRVVDPTKPDA